MTEHQQKLGISGRLADLFKQNQITPLLALVGFLLGLFAVLITPREEEPQIEVTFANVFIPYQGASAAMVERQVAIPAEKIVAEIAGIEHIYSISEPGMALLTVQFTVGEDRTAALVRLYNAFYSNADWQPQDAGIGPVLIKPKGIDDVPVFAVTLWSDNPERTSADLLAAAKGLEEQLQQVQGTRDIYTLGGSQPRVLVRFDAARLHTYGLDLASITQALQLSNQVQHSSGLLQPDRDIQLHTGLWLRSAEQVGELIVAVRQHNGEAMPIYLRDVASVSLGSSEPDQYVQHWQRNADDTLLQSPAVTLYVAKQPGTNAVDVTQAVQAKLAQLEQQYIADDIELTVSRNYGETAEDKANTLIQKLIFATISVVVLVGFALGWREAFVVGMAVVITLAMTLFASWAYGFTLNRVSLFALIFSIGILVDDAIVVVENLHRHMLMGKKSLLEAIPHAVEEVGAPTILATFTVIAALLPMAFVSGLMGPYMSPIPINASMGMLISLLVAFIFTPWLFYRVFIKHQAGDTQADHDELGGKAEKLFNTLMTPFLAAAAGRGNRVKLLVGLLVLIAGSVLLVVNQNVVLKMLPFDNKSEFQVVVDLPEGATLEQTQAVLNRISTLMLAEPEVTHVQTYAGTAAPINFNGLVRQYYLRQYPWQGDVQVNLAHRLDRDEQSHAIALRVRPALQALEQETGYSIKLVEVPPGPPVLAPLVAEIYGPDYAQQLAAAERFKAVFAASEHIVDIDSTVEAPQALWQLHVDQQKAAEYGVSVAAINQAIATAVDGTNAGYLRDPNSYQLIPIELKLQQADSASWQALSQVPVMSQNGELIALSELTYRVDGVRDNAIHRKDLRPVVYVTADLAGGVDSPLYGMIAIHGALADQGVNQHLIAAPVNTDELSVKWDGEWQITYETFRDMGLAYAVGLIMIYLLVVAQFRAYGVPLIIMAPIPLTLIGIMPGHWLVGAQFTATSMIGMIALAGIIVRNSILLVDYIQQQTALGVKLETAVIHASAVRARPIVLTALAAMMGGFFILDDPIFGGLAVSLIFGILVSTLLTLVVIPVVYYAYNYRKYVS